MSTEKTLESAYFHICNGGVTLKIVEQGKEVTSNASRYPNLGTWGKDALPSDWEEGLKTGKYLEKDTEPYRCHADGTPLVCYNRQWHLEADLGNHGAHITTRFPLAPLEIKWLIEALQRTLVHMEAPPEQPTNWKVLPPFDNLVRCFIKYKEGIEVNEDSPPNENPTGT